MYGRPGGVKSALGVLRDTQERRLVKSEGWAQEIYDVCRMN
jgi:hypothetical protein